MMASKRRKQIKSPKLQPKEVQSQTMFIDPGKLKRYNVYAIIGLVVLYLLVYMTTMLPGVNSGDSAELQYCSKILGVCHSPGYQIEVTFGKLFTMLPIGPDAAWRVNFMMVVFGIAGCLALYGAVKRITGFILPAIAASMTLAFSSIYWTHSLYAEAYVFYASFLLMGLYTFVRYIQDNKFWWLYLTALLVGVCVWDRASELFVMPGFVLALIFYFRKIKWNWVTAVHFVIAIVIFVLPFVYTMSYYVSRTSQEYLHLRDNHIRNTVLSPNGYTPFEPRKKLTKQLLKIYTKSRLGLGYSKQAKFSPEVMKSDIDKYAWLLSGAGGFGDRYEENSLMYSQQGQGTSIGLVGLLLGVAAIVLWRKHYGWVMLGAWFFAGNLIFILWHHRWDNLTFIVPGLIGLALLSGLGAAGPSRWGNQKRRVVFQLCCLIATLFLLVTNYRYMDMSTEQTKQTLEYNHELAATDWPEGAVFLDGYWPAMTLRYLFYVEANRPDIHVMYEDDRPDWNKIIEHFTKQGNPVYLRRQYLSGMTNEQVQAMAARTKPEFIKLGYMRVN